MVFKFIVYVVVKNLKLGVMWSYIIVFDFCGWVCRFCCFICGLNFLVYWLCLGVVNILSRLFLMYGCIYGEVVKRRWSFVVKRCLLCFYGEIFIIYYCNFGYVLLWKEILIGNIRLRNLILKKIFCFYFIFVRVIELFMLWW